MPSPLFSSVSPTSGSPTTLQSLTSQSHLYLPFLLGPGPQINSVVIKGCVQVEDQEPRVTWLRTGPGLSIVTYTHVCRHGDFCNDVNSTEIFENLPTPTGALGRKNGGRGGVQGHLNTEQV